MSPNFHVKLHLDSVLSIKLGSIHVKSEWFLIIVIYVLGIGLSVLSSGTFIASLEAYGKNIF